MKRIILLLALIIFVSLGGYLWHRSQPEQKIGRVVEEFLEHVEHRKISLRKLSDVEEALTATLAEKINFQGDSPIPRKVMSREEAIENVAVFHERTTLCEITEVEKTVKVIDSQAQAYLTIDIKVAATKKYQFEQTWELVLDLEEKEDWKITGLRGTRKF